MRPPRHFAWIAVLLAVVAFAPLHGCSFVAVEDINPEMPRDATACAALNADPDLASDDPCVVWQLVGGFCRFGTRDTDGDGAKDPDCADPNDVIDCAIDDDQRAPNLPELCDGIDNDCDDRVDEDVLNTTSPSITQVPGGIENLSFASVYQNERVAALFTSPLGSPQHVVTTARFAGPRGGANVNVAGSSAITAPARDGAMRGTTAVAANSSLSYVAAVIPAGCQAPMLATFATDPGATDLVFPPGHFGVGLPTESGERCGPSASSLRARTPAVGSTGTRVLAAWVAGSFITSCGSGESAPVLVNGASLNAGMLSTGPNAAIRLGLTNDAAPPAVLPVSIDRFVVAHADGGDLVLSVVNVTDGGGVWRGDEARYATGSDSAGDLTLAVLAPGELVIAFRVGCGTQARVMVAVTGFDVAAGTIADALTTTPQPIEAVSTPQRRPRIVVPELSGTATVAWEAGDEIRLRQLGSDGRPSAPPIRGYTATGTLGAGHYLYSLPGSSDLALIVSDAAPDGSSVLASLELSCGL